MEDELVDERMFLDYPCPKCGGNVGHLINCPDGSCFSKKEGIQLNPMDIILHGLRPNDDWYEKKQLDEKDEVWKGKVMIIERRRTNGK